MYDEERDPEDIHHDERHPDADPDQRERVAGLGAWGLSLVFHALAIAILVLVVVAAPWEPEPAPLKRTVLEVPELREPPEEPPVELKQDVDPTEEMDVEVPSPEFDTEISDLVSDEHEDPTEAKETGDPEQMSDMAMATNVSIAAIGAGASAPGKRGTDGGGFTKRQRAKRHMGPHARASLGAIDRALRWFARHQSPNGMWDVDGYAMNCSGAIKCEPGTAHTDAAGDIAATGYALYCFIGAGYDHKTPNKHKRVVANGLDWLLSVQKPDGMFGRRNYEHPIATMVLADVYSMTGDPRLREPVQRAVDRILERQTRIDDGYAIGWNYVKPSPGRQDSSVTGWNVMALKSAKAGGFAIGDGLTGSKRWLEGAWKAANPDHEQLGSGDSSKFPYTWNALTDETKHENRMPMGGLSAAFLGFRSGDTLLETLVNGIIEEQTPTGYPTNTYYLYYNMMAVFQVGGDRWRQWNNRVTPMLVDAQRRDELCFDGSWDFEGTKFHGHEIGRLVSTAYVCLSLEVAMRSMNLEERVQVGL